MNMDTASCQLDANPAGQPAPVEPSVAPAASAAKQIYVVVERGQSLDRVARDYRVAKQDIIAGRIKVTDAMAEK